MREEGRQDENDDENDDVTRPTYFSGQLFEPGDPSTNGHAEQADRNAAYRAGMCRDCREKPHAAGMPRCNECHAIHVRVTAGYDS